MFAYFSESLFKAERNYCVTRKELLAIFNAVKRFNHYLYERPFLVRTDRGDLKLLMTFKNPEGQLLRWLEFLGTYDFTVEHRNGAQHVNADALSRIPYGNCNYCEKAEQKEQVHYDKASNECARVETNARGLRLAETREVTKAQTPDAWASKWSEMTCGENNYKTLTSAHLYAGRRLAWEKVSAESCAVKAYWSKWIDSSFIVVFYTEDRKQTAAKTFSGSSWSPEH